MILGFTHHQFWLVGVLCFNSLLWGAIVTNIYWQWRFRKLRIHIDQIAAQITEVQQEQTAIIMTQAEQNKDVHGSVH